ncbi:MAG: lytic murein transglycosylase [Patescibacteria group bacterium]
MSHRKHFFKKSLLIITLLVLVLPSFLVFADTLPEDCVTKDECEALLEQYEKELANIDKDIAKTSSEKKTLQSQTTTLQSQIKKLDLQISQSNVMIKDLGVEVNKTESSIVMTTDKIQESRGQLSKILRLFYEADQKSLIEILLTEEELSDFFNDLVALESLNVQSTELLEDIENLKNQLEEEKESLDKEKQGLETLVIQKDLQREESATAKKKKDGLLKLTEAEYQKQLKEKEEKAERAAGIRARIFELIGVQKAPTFGEAYEIAKQVSGITGVRPALLLAVLTQESDIGKNVGQCYLKNTQTGAGVGVNTGRTIQKVMKPSRDVAPFLRITKNLGRDPYQTPVSCPMSYGYGGAMGPAQFIPSTWALYEDRLLEITGSPGDPWDIKDAFLAAGLYLAKYGAYKQTYTAEWRAAMIYFSGSTDVKYRFYGDQVMKKAAAFKDDIEAIENGNGG